MTPPTEKLRPGQKNILQYESGKMGISAVPGSGKTWTLSRLAAKLLKSGRIGPDQEILIVTLVNAAVENFSTRISNQLQEAGLLPGLGYRVRTLHGLAHDIVRERPDLAGLSTDFQIIDEVESTRIIHNLVANKLVTSLHLLEDYIGEEVKDYQRQKVLTDDLPKTLRSTATAFIQMAKDHQTTPETLRLLFERQGGSSLPFFNIFIDIYKDYQMALHYRGAVDFDDLIRLALRCLKTDSTLVDILRQRWPYILEDEAQDSSLLQQEILNVLTGPDGNWVRVGDPNQAIYETFTTANPKYLLAYIRREDVVSKTLPESGRSTQSIISLANYLVKWTQTQHFNQSARQALNPPLIKPTPADDPQPNPSDCPACVRLLEQRFTPEAEVDFILNDIKVFLEEHPDKTIAILSPRNRRGFKFVDAMKERGIPHVDSLLQSTTSTRLSTGAVANILLYLSDSKSSHKLARAYGVWRRAERENKENWAFCQQVGKIINSCDEIEAYLWPMGQDEWLEKIASEVEIPGVVEELINFRKVVRRWQATIFLPIDQLVLTIAQDLFLDPMELALAHKLSALLKQIRNAHPNWQLPELTAELATIARNERKFLGFSDEDSAFDPDLYPGKVVVATMHKAKGLEWDCVYLTSVNNYNFPSGHDYDKYQSEKWFLSGMNIEAEVIEEMMRMMEKSTSTFAILGQASMDARQEFIRERLRLLFVGITRARTWLTATWNTGRFGGLVAALPLLELINFQESQE